MVVAVKRWKEMCIGGKKVRLILSAFCFKGTESECVWPFCGVGA